MYLSSNEEEQAACLPVIKNNLTTIRIFLFALVFVTLQAPNRRQEPILSKGEFPIRIARVLFGKFRLNYFLLWRPQLNLKAVILDFISRSSDKRSIL